jgi:8-oxo-dGTP pyrophosphatase MutT (NUDIX family)
VSDVVRAAGGVPWRRRDGSLEVLLVHRPRYDDWTFPKGKAEDGESDEECALRELEEETGLRGALGTELASTSYTDGRGRPKQVRYWALGPVDGNAEPRHEVDGLAWLTPEDAAHRLSYDRDRVVLRSLVERVT